MSLPSRCVQTEVERYSVGHMVEHTIHNHADAHRQWQREGPCDYSQPRRCTQTLAERGAV
jgi:hypothetical protein